jgi:hypothetical protein
VQQKQRQKRKQTLFESDIIDINDIIDISISIITDSASERDTDTDSPDTNTHRY